MLGFVHKLTHLETLGLAVLVAVGASGAADAFTRIGFVWSSCPNCTGTYTPDSRYTWNSLGGTTTITNVGTGEYTVDFVGLYSAAHWTNVQVSAYGTSGYCTIARWNAEGGGAAAEMYVRCFDASAHLATSHFTLLYQQRSLPFGSANVGAAFLWGDCGSSSCTPDFPYNYNSTGGTNTIVHNSAGNYSVTIPGLTKVGGDVQVTAYGTTPARCITTGWNSSSSGTRVGVQCYNSSGAAADEYFSLAYTIGLPFGADGSTTPGAYAWANMPESTSPYTPAPLYQIDTFSNGILMASKIGTGQYSVSLPPSIVTSSNVLVTGYKGGGYCNVGAWSTRTIIVGCYSQGGSLLDSKFDVSFNTTF
jgi:hypothetical protein